MKFIKRKKKLLERNPLVIYYRLVKLKETNYAYGTRFGSMTRVSNSRRPSIAVDKIVKNIVLNGNWPMGELLNNSKNIRPSKVLNDRLIPCSTCSYGEDRYQILLKQKITFDYIHIMVKLLVCRVILIWLLEHLNALINFGRLINCPTASLLRKT